MMRLRHILPILLLALLAGCASRRAIKSVTPEPVAPTVEEPTWHTCSASAHASVVMSKQQIQATLQLQAVYDSMLVVSIQPLPGLEMARVEATPEQVIVIDKLNKQFAQMDYETLSLWAKRPISWAVMQHLLEANEQEHIDFTADLGGQRATIQISQIQTKWDVPVRLRSTLLTGYKPMTLPEQK